MRLATDLREVILSAEKEIIFISPYYVPGDSGVQLFVTLSPRGCASSFSPIHWRPTIMCRYIPAMRATVGMSSEPVRSYTKHAPMRRAN